MFSVALWWWRRSTLSVAVAPKRAANHWQESPRQSSNCGVVKGQTTALDHTF